MKVKICDYIFWVFLLLFPLDILNFYLEVLNYPNLATGFISYILSLLLVYAFLRDLMIPKDMQFWRYLALFIIFVLSILTSIIISRIGDFNDYYKCFVWFLYFVIGYYLSTILKTNKFKLYLICTNIIFCISIVVFYLSVDIKEYPMNYLRIAESFVLISFLAHSITNKKKYNLLLFVLNIIALFFINSRSALIGYFIFFFLFVYIRYGKVYFFKLISLSSVFGVLVVFKMKSIIEAYNDRILRLFFNKEGDTSLLARDHLLDQGIVRIKENWFSGDFKGQLAYGEAGSYIHNILSYWSQFGLIVFMLVCLLILAGIVVIIQRKRNLPYENFVMTYGFYTMLVLLVSKSYMYNNIYLTFGLILALIKDRNEENDISHSQ